MEKKGTCPRGAACKWCSGSAGASAGPGGKTILTPGSTITKTSPSKGCGKGKSWGGQSWGGCNDMMQMMMMQAMMGGMGGGWGYKGGGKGGAFKSNYKIDESGGVLGEFTGTIKSFNEGKWYGFITCEDLTAQGHADVFLHGDEKKGYREGHKVKFTAFLTKEGKPQAKDLKSGIK